MASNSENREYTNTHGSNQNNKGGDMGEGNKKKMQNQGNTMPEHEGSKLSNENFDRVGEGNVATGSAE